MTEYTPGPWHVAGRTVHAMDTQGLPQLICTCTGINTPPVSHDNTNARLIAAAPDLLQACKVVLDTMQYALMCDPADPTPQRKAFMTCQDCQPRLKAAIGKATGKDV